MAKTQYSHRAVDYRQMLLALLVALVIAAVTVLNPVAFSSAAEAPGISTGTVTVLIPEQNMFDAPDLCGNVPGGQAGYTVTLMRAGKEVASGVSNNTGEVVFPNLVQGSYQITTDAPEQAGVRWLAITDYELTLPVVREEYSQPIWDVRITLKPSGFERVCDKDEELPPGTSSAGRPVSGFEILVLIGAIIPGIIWLLPEGVLARLGESLSSRGYLDAPALQDPQPEVSPADEPQPQPDHTPQSPGRLALTGSEILPLGMVGMLILLAGAALVVGQRRRIKQ